MMPFSRKTKGQDSPVGSRRTKKADRIKKKVNVERARTEANQIRVMMR